MFATASVQLAGTEKAVFVTQDAVVSNPGLESAQVFLVDGGVARSRVVQLGGTGIENDGMVRVLTGLSGGEIVATKNLNQLYDGAAVRN
jgi:multidrug efflux pump subunit AcrA (membrane-fusion protein)